MAILWAILVLLALLLAAGLGCTLFATRRGRSRDPRDPETVARSAWSRYAEPVLAGIAWLDAQETERITIESFDGLRLSARVLPCAPCRGTILLFHGYRSSAEVDFSCVFSYYHALGFRLVLADQRAHGRSQGRYLTYGVRERRDCQRWAWECYRRFGPDEPLLLDGLSMGATTVLLAADLELPPTVRGIVADCGFTSPWEIIAHVMKTRFRLPVFPLLYVMDGFCRLLAGFRLKACSTMDALARTDLPVLLFHGEADRFVPCDMSRRNRAACRSECRLLTVPGASHGVSFLVDQAACSQALEAFLDAHIPDKKHKI